MISHFFTAPFLFYGLLGPALLRLIELMCSVQMGRVIRMELLAASG